MHKMTTKNSLKILLVIVGLVILTNGQPTPGSTCFCFEEVGTPGDFYQITAIENVQDGSQRLFVMEQRGYVWIYMPDGSRVDTPFINMTGTELYVYGDLGMYGLAFHPNLTTDQRVYLHYAARYDGTTYQRISEMTVSTTDPNVVDTSTERILVDVYQGQVDGHVGGAVGEHFINGCYVHQINILFHYFNGFIDVILHAH